MSTKKKKYNFCTIHNYKFIPQLLVQREFFEKVMRNQYVLWVLCVDYETYAFIRDNKVEGIIPVFWQEITDSSFIALQKKLKNKVGKLCWASKPFFLKYLLEEKNLLTLEVNKQYSREKILIRNQKIIKWQLIT